MFRSVNVNRISGVNSALKVLLLAKDSGIYVPLSSVWENGNSTDLDYAFFDLAYSYRQIELVSECVTIEEFIDRNRQLYFFDKDRYNCYFSESELYYKFRPTIIKKRDSTNNLKRNIEEWKFSDKLPILMPNRDIQVIEYNKSKIIDISRRSEGKGITKSLFQGKLEKQVYEFSISRLLSTSYINGYLSFLDGDIATGVSDYISYYDTLSKNFPYNDIPVLSVILESAGVNKEVFTLKTIQDWDTFLISRCNPQHERICEYIRKIIEHSLLSISFSETDTSNKVLSNNLVINIKRIASFCIDKIIKINSIKQLDVLENNLLVLLNCFSRNEPVKSSFIINKGGKPMHSNNKVFIVHGHNELLKEQVSNWLYSINLEPIVLHKKASGGVKSIIDKIEKYSEVSCAIVLLTADDYGKAKNDDEYNFRARQNVVFEAGYFIGKIGASNVILLHEENVELPSDLGGCVFITADERGGWKEQMRIEFDELKLEYKK